MSTALILAATISAHAPASVRTDAVKICEQEVSATIGIDEGHPWRAPFHLDRVGRRPAVRLEITMPVSMPVREYAIVGYRDGKEFERHSITASYATIPAVFSVPFSIAPDEVVLMARCRLESPPQEVARGSLAWPALEMDAVASPDRRINPVDLGSILVPHDRLLLASGQSAVIDVAAFWRGSDLPNARLRAWFSGGRSVEIAMPLPENKRMVRRIELPLDVKGDRSVLHVSLSDGTRELWNKEIQTSIVERPPRWPRFGAVETKLRYDAPISSKDSTTGKYSFLDYEKGWDSRLNDVVVFLPNGARFVFWRGSSYVPFWAGKYNTGFNYQWAESWGSGRGVDTNEPLMDRELRYGRVRIIESSASRVHVRWTYPLSDFEYRILGDRASEDYYFYPDGFGTRVLTLTSFLNNEIYQVSEFIILTPQSAYPLEVLPEVKIDLLTLDGGKRRFILPGNNIPNTSTNVGQLTRVDQPTLYRVSIHKDDPATAIHFNPNSGPMVMYAYSPFYDRGKVVTPAYWGEHWPLGRGSTTGAGISERIHLNPSHNSIATWFNTGERGILDFRVPERHLSSSIGQTIDALGQARIMETRRWAWMIAYTDLPDDVLRSWGQSFAGPPAMAVTGARLDDPAYSMDRRALRLIAEQPSITIKVTPEIRTVNPVFEIAQAPQSLASVTLDGKSLNAADYSWDGAILWMNATIDAEGATVGLRFQ